MRRIAGLAILLLTSLPALALEGYVAVYEVKSKGLTAISETSLKKTGSAADGAIFEFRSTSKTKGLARLIRRAPAIEISRFRYDGEAFMPLEFHFINGKESDERSNHILFSGSDASSSYKGQSVSIAMKPGYVDRALEQVVVRQSLQDNDFKERLLVVDRNEVREIDYTAEGTGSIDTILGTMQAISLLRQRPGSSRSTRIWYAIQLDYFPVRIEQMRNGEITAVATLVSYRPIAN